MGRETTNGHECTRMTAMMKHGGNLGVRWQSEERAPTPPWEGRMKMIVRVSPPATPSNGGVAQTLPAALQGAAQVSGSRLITDPQAVSARGEGAASTFVTGRRSHSAVSL